MNVLVTMNDNYMIPLLIMLESLFDHEKREISVYLIYSDITAANRRRINRFIKNRGGRFIAISVKEELFDSAPVFRYFTKEMYYRFLCSRLLPETVDRILYLDPDILIRNSVSSFYDQDFDGKLLIGVGDYASNTVFPEKKFALGLTEKDIYINSGVLLFNLKKMRETFVLEDFIHILEEKKEIVSYPDQDIMNVYFKGEIKIAGEIYNYGTGYKSKEEMLCWLLGKREKTEPVIVHYMGETKPWNVNYYNKYFFEYYAYLKQYLGWKGKLLYFFKPCYVAVKVAKAMFRISVSKK